MSLCSPFTVLSNCPLPPRWAWTLSVLFVLLLVGCAPNARAHPNRGPASLSSVPAPDTSGPIVKSVRLVGNEQFSDDELKRRLRTRPNRRVFGIPGLTWWRWIGAESPAYVDTTTIQGDVERLRLFYEQKGFREARVTSEIRRLDPDEVEVVFRVDPGPPTFLRRISYSGLGVLPEPKRRALVEGTVLSVDSLVANDSVAFRVDEQRFDRPLLVEERQRLLRFLQNEGFAAVNRDSIQAVFRPVPSGAPDIQLQDVTFQIRPGPQYRIGDVHAVITGSEPGSIERDTLDEVDVDASGGGRPQVTMEIRDETLLKPALVRRALQFTPGAVYSRSALTRTKQRLDGTGAFTFTNVTPQFEDAVSADSLSAPYLPIRIEGQTRQRHQLRSETFALQRRRAEVIGLNEFGIGASGGYENLNAFGGGEGFQLRVSGSVATALDTTVISSTQFEATGSFTLPYLIRPFDQFENVFDLTNARTQISLSGLTARRNDLRLQIRSRINARLRIEMNHTPTRTSLLDVMDLNVSNPDTLSGFGRRFLDRVFGTDGEGIQDPVQRQQILEDYTEPQLNTAQRYTFRSATANPLQRQQGHIYEATAEVGNTLPRLLDRFVLNPGSVDYRLPGFGGGSPAGTDGRLLFRPYVRTTVDLRRYFSIGRGSVFGLKFFGGLAHPTGGLDVVPFDRRFFSGGANSVRGWRLRDLGPGGSGQIVDDDGTVRGDASSILGGDLKLESSAEIRTPLFRDFLTADWIGATFVDVGNVWFGPRNPGFSPEAQRDGNGDPILSDDRNGKFRGLGSFSEVGVGGGFGLRLNWDFLILRFDLAYRLHDPSPANDDVFGDSFSGPLLHFGLGQAF